MEQVRPVNMTTAVNVPQSTPKMQSPSFAAMPQDSYSQSREKSPEKGSLAKEGIRKLALGMILGVGNSVVFRVSGLRQIMLNKAFPAGVNAVVAPNSTFFQVLKATYKAGYSAAFRAMPVLTILTTGVGLYAAAMNFSGMWDLIRSPFVSKK